VLGRRVGSAGGGLLCVGGVVRVLGEGVIRLRVLLENLNALVCLVSVPLHVLLRFIVCAHGCRHVVVVWVWMDCVQRYRALVNPTG
jgi:hypothetical protein